MIDRTTGNDMPWQTPWESEGLEHLGSCPVCCASRRTVLHKDVVDNVFFCSPGKWTLLQCEKCRSAYLDPRPTPDTIHQAYTNYYTHQDAVGKDDYASLSPFRKLRRRLVNGYTNWRYSTSAQPSSNLGVLAAFAMPRLKKVLDRQSRNLPKLPQGGGRLLDVGSGDGSFLSFARTCGWDVVGLDPDAKAVANAARQGLTVHEGGIEYFADKSELFDVITLNHVIEHVYDPVKVLKTCHALLKPGGQLWLETPNIDSFGHTRFQKNWRGLETPRHLVLFNRHSLRQAFINAGFPAPHDRASPSACAGMFKASFAMVHGHSPYKPVVVPKALQLRATIAAFAERLLPSRREFLTVTARKALC
jgi:2-polyprenyl-3-methyl-5-hydroxy-6-metoxy-1,4-benzoquinol methylase